MNGGIIMDDKMKNSTRNFDINKVVSRDVTPKVNTNLIQNQEFIKQISKQKSEEIERQLRTNELLELNVEQNKQLIRLGEVEVSFLEKINKDTLILVNLLNNIEQINRTNGTITQENMLFIQQRLDEIISSANPTSINQLFLEEVKKQIAEKGVSFGLQLFITGIKLLLTPDKVS